MRVTPPEQDEGGEEEIRIASGVVIR